MSPNKLPPFVLPYKLAGKESSFFMNCNRPVKATIAQDWVLKHMESEGVEKTDFFTGFISAFWIIEGFLFSADLIESEFPTLHYYLGNRDGLSIPQRWELYKNVELPEVASMVEVYNATRQNPLHTEIDTPVEEKKSELEHAPSV